MKSTSGVQVGRALFLTLCLLPSQSLFASATGNADGYGLSAQVSLGALASINIPHAPNPPVAVNATGSNSGQTVGVNTAINAGLLGTPVTLSSGLITGTAQATLQGYDTDAVLATGEVDNTNLSISAVAPVLGLGAAVIKTSAQASCSGGVPVFAGKTTISNLNVRVLGLPVTVPAAPGPNTALNVPLAGLSIVLNEQIASTTQITVNGVHLSLKNYLLSAVLGTLNLNITLATASAQMQSACVAAPALTLTKVADASFVRGSNGSYTFTVENIGGATAQAGLTLTDVLPAGLSYVSANGAGWSCNAARQTVTCNNATTALAPGASSTLNMVVSVGSGTANPVANTAVVGNPDQPPPGDCASATPSNGCATTTTTVLPALTPILGLLKTANGSFVRGASGSYTLLVSNTGLAPAIGPITVTDTLPAGMSYTSVSGSGWSCSAAAQTVTCSNPSSLAILGTSSLSLTVAIAATTASPAVNTASVGSTNDPAPTCTTGSLAIGCGSVTTPVIDAPAPGLQLSMTSSPVFIRGGANNVYTYTISNNGSVGAVGPIALDSTMSSGLSFNSIVSGNPGDWQCTGSAFPCSYTLALPAGGSVSMSVKVDVAASAPDLVENQARIGNAQLPIPATCSGISSAQCSTLQTPVQNAAQTTSPLLTLSKTAIGTFVRGASGSYRLGVTNSGTAATSGLLTITDTLPTGLTYSGFSGSGWTCAASGPVITCTNPATLAISASSQVIVDVAIAANATSPLTNNAVVGSGNDPAPDCSTQQVAGCASTTTPVSDPPLQGQPHLTLTKTANGSFVRGASGSYTLAVTNTGSASTSGALTLIDTLPAGLTYSGSSGSGWGCSASGQTVTCSDAALLAAGASTQVVIDVAIASTAANSITNSAVVGTPSDPPPSCTPPVDGCATTTTPVNDPPVQGRPHLTLSKVAQGTFVQGGDGGYALTVTNTGSVGASGPITLTDQLPSGLRYVSASGAGWACSVAAQTVTCTNPSTLGAGSSSVVNLIVTIAANAPNPVTNSASVGTPGLPAPSCTTPVDGCAKTTTPVNTPSKPVRINASATPEPGVPAPVNTPFALLMLVLGLPWLARRMLLRGR